MNRDTWTKVKHVVNERDHGLCLRCLLEATDIHHRVVRGMKHSNDPEVQYGLAGLVAVCRRCHDWIHSHVAESYSQGWLVHSWDDPEEIPVIVTGDLIGQGTYQVTLTKEGERFGEPILF